MSFTLVSLPSLWEQGLLHGGYFERQGDLVRWLLLPSCKDKKGLNLDRGYQYGEVFRGHRLERCGGGKNCHLGK
jgi:hypothetical protein